MLIKEAAALVRQSPGSGATKLLRLFRDVITRSNNLNAYVTIADKTADAAAEQADERARSGSLKGELDGVPIAVKDNFCVKGMRTTCGSAALAEFDSGYTATAIDRLERKGAAIIGKTNLDEFGMGSFNLNSAFGPTHNPVSVPGDTSPRSAGGSSGGSAAAVAAGTCVAAIGSDTGGSVRLPASYCGVVGWKPAYGRTSRYGLVAYASSLDTPGVLARSVADAAIIGNVMSGADEQDSTCTLPPTTFVPTPGAGLDGISVGIPMEYHIDSIDVDILGLWRQGEAWIEEAGARIESVSLPQTKEGLPAYYLLAVAEASSNLARYDGMQYGTRSGTAATNETVEDLITASRGISFCDEVKRRILAGAFTLSRRSYESYYLQAQRVRRLICKDFDRVFSSGVDVLLTPTTPTVAPTLEEAKALSRVQGYANDVFTVPASLAGLPAISVPVGNVRGLPVGLQLIGKVGCEETLLRVAQAIEDHASHS